ncbi:MAG TPA: dihydropteroate synthase, partial [Dehalococcoidia bacterium]|nr:dihydropteroate synthase [Dehalococcoidia bacterium]
MTSYLAPSMTIRGRRFDWGARTYVMGIVNLSPESFSGDGVGDLEAAVAQARRFEGEGADLIDVGGMSTRPDFSEISLEEETNRVVPAIEAIVDAVDLPVSI